MKGSYIELEVCGSLAHLLATPQVSSPPLLDTREEQLLSLYQLQEMSLRNAGDFLHPRRQNVCQQRVKWAEDAL